MPLSVFAGLKKHVLRRWSVFARHVKTNAPALVGFSQKHTNSCSGLARCSQPARQPASQPASDPASEPGRAGRGQAGRGGREGDEEQEEEAGDEKGEEKKEENDDEKL